MKPKGLPLSIGRARRLWPPLLATLLLAIGLAALPVHDASIYAGPGVVADPVAGELIDLAACEYHPADDKDAVYAAECATLVVPENRDEADSRLITLPVVRIPATGPEPGEPIFYLQGGPGQSNLSWAPPDWLLEKHDLVFVGYRGVDGQVALACPGVSRAIKGHVGEDLLSERARADYITAVTQCAADHQRAGADLTGYTIPAVVADMEDARAALGYGRVNLLSESYGTRVAQLYAYLHPDSLHRLVLIGVNTPGRFVYDRAELDGLLQYISDKCAEDHDCAGRTDDFAQTVYEVNRNMPERWLIFNIDPATVRLGANFLFFDTPNMPLVFDAYLAAAEGNPSGLAMLNLVTSLAPIDGQLFGDQAAKAGSADMEWFDGAESAGLGDSIMGAPMTEWIWPIAQHWPVELIPAELRELQESDVEMLLVNGTVDVSTPPTALDEVQPYYHRAQMVLLPEFGHIGDVMRSFQPEAFEQLITSYYDTGIGDSSLYTYQPLSFEPDISLTTMASGLVLIIILLAVSLVVVGLLLARRFRRRRRSDSAGAA